MEVVGVVDVVVDVVVVASDVKGLVIDILACLVDVLGCGALVGSSIGVLGVNQVIKLYS